MSTERGAASIEAVRDEPTNSTFRFTLGNIDYVLIKNAAAATAAAAAAVAAVAGDNRRRREERRGGGN